MFKRGRVRLQQDMLAGFGHAGQGETNTPAMNATGGLPFYGNLFQGRVNADDFQPSMAALNPETRMEHMTLKKVYADDDPVIRAKIDRCPYFGLCDMVVWQGMAPTFLDPGVLTDEEHYMMLLWSRGYYEKWREIHAKPRELMPRIRVKKGRFRKTRQLLEHAGVDSAVIAKAESMLIDDSSIIGMHPDLWRTAHLDETLRDHLTGRCLEMAGVTERQRAVIFDALDRMRTLVVWRKDLGADRADTQTFHYRDVGTLYTLHRSLGLQSYSGQLKVPQFHTGDGTQLSITLSDEDSFFDFIVHNFYRANLTLAGSTSPYTVVVEKSTRAEQAIGSWF